jgi:pantoate--beta-alanine ligase
VTTTPEARGALAILRSVDDLRASVRAFRSAGETVALVPTMGALHEGHLALVRRGRILATRVIATIFVNPTQFGPNEDLDGYPRDRARDVAKLESVETDALFVPELEEMYPPGASTTVAVSGLTDGLCGPFRPGHFAGVATIVTKLLLQALPDVALFGEKDFQQLLVIKRLARDLDIPVRIEGVPTVREPDGLALSSRNAYLSSEERGKAATLYRVLKHLAGALAAGADAAPLLAEGRAELLKAGFDPVQYLALCGAETLKPLARADRPSRVFAAAYLGGTRLIDNVPVGR